MLLTDSVRQDKKSNAFSANITGAATCDQEQPGSSNKSQATQEHVRYVKP